MLEFLTDEGFLVETAPSVTRVLSEVEKRSYSLIVADVFDRGVSRWPEIERLIELSDPTPVAVCTASRTPPPGDVLRRLSFYLEKPFQAERLLQLVSEHSGAQGNVDLYRPQAEAYFAALTKKDWDSLAALCSEDVVYFFPTPHPEFGRKVEGRDAFIAFTREIFAQFPATRFTIVSLSPLANGVVASYRADSEQGTPGAKSSEGAVVLRISDGKVCRIGIRMERLPFALN